MATDKSKTSKTARVMNLLSKKSSAPAEPPAGETAPADETAPAGETAGAPAASTGTNAAPAPAAAPAEHRSQTPPILSSITADAAASNQIRSALEDALAAELDAAPAPQPTPEPEPAPAPAAEPAPVQTAPAQPEPQPAPEPVQAAPQPAPAPAQPAPAPVQAAPAPEPVPAAPTPAQVAVQTPVPEEDEEPGYINVMQVLVDEKAPKYIKMFGLCDCKRCTEDVKALALNHLPPKYVVLGEGERVPKLTFYEGQYSSDITAQLLKACQKVAERPHHTRN